ncbi:zinc finger HIT domain-containing protein 3 [Trichogramma pretiosum]|uniref:zinc finger HIT domain-containing protein 3 n=1 Tax=Trichogramma pretiosum TaxID=7493 RepID=UPI0006C9BA39|nr:zinc finger HIT domain-containing protein 3 [Trichogramma pretiosum]
MELAKKKQPVDKTCCVCSRDNSSYRCPKCRRPYCSISCHHIHKQDDLLHDTEFVRALEAEKEAQKVVSTPKSYKYPTESTVPMEKLERLRQNEELKNCLKNPHLKDYVREILEDSDPTGAISRAMKEPLFVELADHCLKVVQDLPEEEK